jgi:uncharacterized membrane protein
MKVMGDLTRSSTQGRIRAIDAARGTAMLFVFLSHFVEAYFRQQGLPVTRLFAVTMVASPAFISISGLILGLLYCTKGERFQATKWRFVWRGVFLLTLGRVLIYVAHIPLAGGWDEALRWAFMTDAIGFCILVGPWVVENVGRRARIALGIGLYIISWGLICDWAPQGGFAWMAKEFLFGPAVTGSRFFTDVFPIFPWFGLYLIATVIGEQLGATLMGGESKKFVRLTLLTALGALGLSAVLFGGRLVLERGFGLAHYEMHVFLSPLQKLPPGPVYFLVFSACAFLWIWILMRFSRVRVIGWYSAFVEVIGRNSLFVFIVQYFAYFTILVWVRSLSTAQWLLYFTISVVAIWTIAYAWDLRKRRGVLSKVRK